ncbi:helix-turn-helix transcriptional regulator [Neobacillus bataviensis]|nr:helix-turn-helix transcriptional regulator [Neobacillus bataviensis]
MRKVMFGLGKRRSKLGRWLDSRGISQQWLSNNSGVGRTTISDLCKGDNEHTPNMTTIQKIIKALKKIDPNINSNDFFDM